MRKLHISRVALAAVSLLLFMIFFVSGCDNSFGILASIQKETRQIGTDVFLKGSVKSTADDGTNLFVAMAKLYRRGINETPGSDAWKVLSIKTSGTTITNYECVGIASLLVGGSPQIFTLLTNPVTREFEGLYSSTDSGETWNSLGGVLLEGNYPQSLYAAKDSLFISVRKKVDGEDRYDLYRHSSGTGDLELCATVSGYNEKILGVWNDGTEYLVLTSQSLYRGADTSSLVKANGETSQPATGTIFRGGGLEPETKDLFLTSSTGKLYRRQKSVAQWTEKTVVSGVNLGMLVAIPASMNPGSTGPRIVIARYDSAYGYLEYDWMSSTYKAGIEGKLIPSETSYSTTLAGKPVTVFHVATTASGNRLFCGSLAATTTTYALYSNLWNPGTNSWKGWEAE